VLSRIDTTLGVSLGSVQRPCQRAVAAGRRGPDDPRL